MNKFEQTIAWFFFRPWPIWTMACIAGIHLLIIWTMPVDVIMTNKIASASMQIVGGLIVIYSVDSNLGLFGKKSLPGTVLAWFNENPLRSRKPVNVTIHASTGNIVCSGASVSIVTATTIEERIAALESISNQLRIDIEERHQTALSRIDEVSQEFNTSIAGHKSAMDELTRKVESTAIGGFKQQSFGVMLAIWGAGTSVFA